MIAPRQPLQHVPDIPEQVRQFVYQTLCETNQLEPGIFPMQESYFFRKGAPCAALFCVQGPRLMKVMAIWDLERQDVLFYNAAGERYLVARAPVEPPSLP
ncbi:hypothetical protein THTE_3630 [Thermogutta terrifontis]|uniref:Uncharacterized protein n=1 Tax=Thermogutta terrifontis TaxID=1331910 RepID=A0A286RJT8_9BACT|nr:hypothetical protein [Thermogutta terrifontis]ASV76231.1 hypothetical protein THTE_3630 [Thermogutta terrifontis]